MAYEATGTILEIFDTQVVSDKFSKREFILNIPDGKFEQQIKFQFTQDKCTLLDQYCEGVEVKVAFNLSGKGFAKNGTTMYFTNLQAWKLEAVGNTNSKPTGQSKQPVEDNSDLPF